MQCESRRGVIANQAFLSAFAGAFDQSVVVIRFLADDRVIAAFRPAHSIPTEVIEFNRRANLFSFRDGVV